MAKKIGNVVSPAGESVQPPHDAIAQEAQGAEVEAVAEQVVELVGQVVEAEQVVRNVEIVWSRCSTDAEREQYRTDIDAIVTGGMLPALTGTAGGLHFVMLVRPIPMSFPVTVNEGV